MYRASGIATERTSVYTRVEELKAEKMLLFRNAGRAGVHARMCTRIMCAVAYLSI